MEFSRQEFPSFPSPGGLPNPVIEPRSPTLQVDSLPPEPWGKPKNTGVCSLSVLQQIFHQGTELGSTALQVDSLPTELLGKPKHHYYGKCHYSELKKYPLMVLPIQCLPVFPLHGLPFHTYAYLYTYVFVFTYYFIFIYRSTYSLKKIILFI